ncbi:unnamed protein product [Protopolystoma xenopodis]|uniref:Zinc/iron permease n=1 Tax=Protopolystoma xenopodis TaxID=117903 RepID=A0A3S4ZZ15_9PLAT|nr:unnamed protein product [Protopolystoma xenopodis]
MDLLPDVNEAMDQAMNEMKFETEFPLSSFISLVGFFLVLSVEQVVLSHRESRSTNQTARVQNIAQLSDQAVESKWRALLRRSARLPSSQAPVDRDGPARLSLPGGTFRSVFRPTRGNSLMSRRGLIEDEATSQTTTPPAQTQDRQRPFFPPSPEPVSPQANGSLDRNPSQAYNPFRQSDATGYISPANFSDDRQHTFSFFHDHPTYDDDHHQHLHHLHHDPEHYHHHRHHHHQHGHNANPEVANSPVFRVVLLLVAMSLHAVFEGLAVGLQDSVQHTITLFSALALHKLIMAIGIGVNLATVHSHPGHSSTGPHANSETRRHSHIAEFESRPSELGLPSGGERHSSEAPLLDQPRGDDETGEAKSSHNVFPSWPGPHGDRSVGPSQSTSRGSAKKRSLHDLRMKGLACLVFASASPIGVLVGWGLMQQHQSPGLLLSTAVLQGLACGTFFYVVFCELLPGEFHGGAGSIHHDRLPKLSFLMFGFLLIAVYLYFQPG